MDCTELNRVRKEGVKGGGGAERWEERRRKRGEEGWEKYQPERWRTTDGEGKKKTGEEEKHGEIQFTQQCAGIQTNNYSTRSFHCVSWDDESSKANFDSSLLKLLSASCLAESEVKGGRERDMGQREVLRDQGQKGRNDRHERMSLLTFLATNWLFDKAQSLYK